MSAAELADTRAGLALIDEYGQVALQRSYIALAQLDRLGITPGGEDAATLEAIVAADFGDVEEAIETLATLDALGHRLTRPPWARNSASSAACTIRSTSQATRSMPRSPTSSTRRWKRILLSADLATACSTPMIKAR